MIAGFVVTLAISLCCTVRFCAGDADDVTMNQQIKQCAAAIKNDLQAAITNDEYCTKEIAKECIIKQSIAAVRLEKLRCSGEVKGKLFLGGDLKAKLTCLGQGDSASKELIQRLCFATELSRNTKNGKGADPQMLESKTPSSEFVEGLIAVANVDEVGPDVSMLATFLGQAETKAKKNCKKYVVSCEANPGREELKTSIRGDGCVWTSSTFSMEDENGYNRKDGYYLQEKRKDPISVYVYSLAVQFKLKNPNNRLAKIMSSIDALHCGDNKSVAGKRSFTDYASALNKVATKIKANP